MPKITIPLNKQWAISYAGEFQGHIVRSYNADFHAKEGSIVVGATLAPHTTTDDSLPGLGLPTDVVLTNADSISTKYWFSSERMYKQANPTNTIFVADAITDTPTAMADSDLAIIGRNSTGIDIMIVDTGTNLAKLNGTWDASWWITTLGQTALSSSFPTILNTFGNTLVIGNGTNVHSVILNKDFTYSTSYQRLAFSGPYSINWIKSTKSKIYIGLKNVYGDVLPSIVAEYDIINETVREMEIQEGTTIGYIVNDNCHILDYKGQLREYTGTGFRVYAGFPTVWIDGVFMSLPHRNGISVFEGKVNFLIPGVAAKMLGGIWSYDIDAKRLYHTKSPIQRKDVADSFGSTYLISTGATYNGPFGSFSGISFYKSYTGTILTGLFSVPKLTNSVIVNGRLHIITPRILSSAINSIWRNLLVKYSPAMFPTGLASGQVLVKYRTSDETNPSGVVFTGTWTAANTFTCSTTPTGNYQTGDEIFVTTGSGSGFSAIISTITAGAPNTITLTTSFSGDTPTGSFAFFVENWKLLGSTTDNTKQSVLLDIPNPETEWIQFKVECTGGFAIEELQLGLEPNLKVEQDNPRA